MSTIRPYPSQVFLELCLTCNLRCMQCDMHRLRNPKGELSLAERKQVIDQVAEWSPDIDLVLSGGEPFTRREQLYELVGYCKQLGITTAITTNGTLITEEDIERLPASGVTTLVVSLDSHDARVHDRMRGVPGTFERAVRTISSLVAARDASEEKFRVLTSTIVGSHNLDSINELVDFISLLGVDYLIFQPVQPVFARAYNDTWWMDDPLFPSREQIDRGSDALLGVKRAGIPMLQSEEQLEIIRYFFLHKGRLATSVCRSMERNLMIDGVGNVGFCFFMERRGIAAVSNVRSESLPAIWTNYADIKRRMEGCNECCAVMLCHSL